MVVPGLEYLSAARSLHPELHAGSTLASQDFQLSLEGKIDPYLYGLNSLVLR